MDSNSQSFRKILVHKMLNLTAEQRQLPHLQSICQYVYCKFFLNDFDELNATCHVSPEKLSLTDESPFDEQIFRSVLRNFIQIYIYPIFIVMGILGNSLSCFIMFLNIRRNGYSANLYLALLAFVDCLFILGSALPEWLGNLDYSLNIRQISEFCCRFVYWFGNFMTHLSVGLVISVTVERFIAIKYPLIAHKIHSAKHTHILLLILILFLFIVDSRLLFLLKHLHEYVHIVYVCPNDTEVPYVVRDIIECGIANENHKQIWLLFDFFVYTFIPFLIIVTLNSLIIHHLILAQRLRQHMSFSSPKIYHKEQKILFRNHSDNPESENLKYNYLRRCRSVPERTSSTILLRPPTHHHHTSNRSSFRQSHSSSESPSRCRNSIIRHRTNSNNIRLTILLLVISGSFLLLTLPAVVLNLIIYILFNPQLSAFEQSTQSSNQDLHITTKFCYTIGRLLMIINHSINFILYFVVGKRFRRDLKILCLRHWRNLSRQ